MDDAELARKIEQLIQCCGKDRVRNIVHQKCRGRRRLKTTKPTSMSLLASVHLMVGWGAKRKTVVRQQLEAAGLPADDKECDRLRTLSRNRKAEIKAFLAENGIKEGSHPGPKPIFDVEELFEQRP